MSVQIILLERIESLGQMGDIVTVKPGFARNYLLPKKKALRATRDNLALFEKQRVQLEATHLQKRQEAEKVLEKISDFQIQLIRSASDAGHLYGAVRSKDIAEALTENGITVHRNQIQILTPIKSLGVHKVYVVLHPEVKAEVRVMVAKSVEEAEAALNLENESNSQKDSTES